MKNRTEEAMKFTQKITLCGAVIAALTFTGALRAANEPGTKEKSGAPMSEQGKLDRNDEAFLKKAAEINLTEIELGKVAQRLSSDPNIKKMGENLMKDHQAANQKLERLAASKGITLPTELSAWDRHSLNVLEKEQGDKFNKEFLSFNIKGHEKAISLFEKESSRTQDQDIKTWAQRMLPGLKEHLAMSQGHMQQPVGEKSKQQQPSQKERKNY